MATKQELLNAMKVIKEHCKSVQLQDYEYVNFSCVDICPIGEFCEHCIGNNQMPEDWDLSDLEKDGGESERD